MREHPDADTILLPSPHWPTAGAIEPLEREFGVNVMSAQQAIVWDALRRCGVNDKIEGFGRLFRGFWAPFAGPDGLPWPDGAPLREKDAASPPGLSPRG